MSSEEGEEKGSYMFMSKWQVLLLRLPEEETGAERFRDLPQATQQLRPKGSLFMQSGMIHLSGLVSKMY